MIALPHSRHARVALAAVAQLGIVVLAVAAPLSARLTGTQYLMRVAPLDPVDPFRGAYVSLAYPDLAPAPEGTPDGTVFVPLVRATPSGPAPSAGSLWRGGTPSRTSPAAGPYLRCQAQSGNVACGIDSWFLPQAKAAAAGRALTGGTAVAVLRVDAQGHAALVGLRPAG